MILSLCSVSVNPIRLICFYETLPVFGSILVVPKDSATIDGYNLQSIPANHRDMVRFDDRNSPGFVSIQAALKLWIDAIDIESARHVTDENKLELLQSLAFPEMDRRQATVEHAANDTCEWLFKDSTYTNWRKRERLEASHGLLWIKGKPGSGKSTLMKHAFEAQRKALEGSGSLCLAFFFNARGADIERSPLGLYRTLLYQLASQCSDIRYQLTEEFLKEKSKRADGVTWQPEVLRDLFHKSITGLEVPPLHIFVDALDECFDDDIVRRVVNDFCLSAEETLSKGVSLNLCWSSRHYPHISVKHAFELRLQDHNGSDIALYVQRQLNASALLSSVPELEQELIEKAKGVFLWIVLVVKKLLKAADQGQTIGQLQDLLHKIPSQLDALFQSILDSLDPELRMDTLHLVQWVLVAFRPLSMEEGQLACALSAQDPPFSLERWSSSFSGPTGMLARTERRMDFLKLFVTERSGGLFEVVPLPVKGNGKEKRDPNGDLESNANQHKKYVGAASTDARENNASDIGQWKIQVIHESVREFLLGEHISPRFSTGLWGSFEEEAHLRAFETLGVLLQMQELSCIIPEPQANLVFQTPFPDMVTVGHKWYNSDLTKYARDYSMRHLDQSKVLSKLQDLDDCRKTKIKEACRRMWTFEPRDVMSPALTWTDIVNSGLFSREEAEQTEVVLKSIPWQLLNTP